MFKNKVFKKSTSFKLKLVNSSKLIEPINYKSDIYKRTDYKKIWSIEDISP